MTAKQNASGLIEFLPTNVEKAPQDAGVFLVISSGQKVLYVGETAERGIREALWKVLEQQPFGAVEYFSYAVEADAARAKEIAAALIAEHKPPHNLGYGRFRNEEVHASRQARGVRWSAPNPNATI